MSKNNKNRQRHQAAKVRNRTKGYKGPARTTKTNTKKNAWYQLKNAAGILICLLSKDQQKEFKKGGKKRRKDDSSE